MIVIALSTPFWVIFGFALLAALINLGGLLLIRRYEAFARRNSVMFAAFAAGVLVTTALVQLIPGSLEIAPAKAPFFLLGGYLLMYGLGPLTGDKVRTGHTQRRAVAIIPLIGIGLHSLIDGIVYSVAFRIDFYTGLLSIFGLMLHEFPEGILAYVLLLRGGFRPRTAFLLAFLAAAATTPLGMVLSYPFIHTLSGSALGLVYALTAGVLLFVGASHLVPHVEHSKHRGTTRVFLAGVGTAILILFLPHL